MKEVRILDFATEFSQALDVRLKVFVDEQNVPLEEERDELDDRAIHFGLFVDERMVATARLVLSSDHGKIGRMAVLPQYRGQGLGLELLRAVIKECQARGLKEAILSAQTHAIPFYEKAGFRAEGEIYMDANIPHRTMRLGLPAAPQKPSSTNAGEASS